MGSLSLRFLQGVGSPLRRGHSFPELHNKSIVRVHVFSASHTSGRPAERCINTRIFAGGTACDIYQNGKRPLYNVNIEKTGLSSNKSQWLLQRAAVRVSCQRRSTHCISQGVCLHLSCLSGGEDSNNFWEDSDVTTLQHLHLDNLQFRFVLVLVLFTPPKGTAPPPPSYSHASDAIASH